MSSPLDLTGNANDDVTPSRHRHPKTRRDKRQVQVEDTMLTTQESDIATSAPRAMVNFLGNFAFVMLFNVIMLFFGAIARGFSRVFGNSWNFLTPAEENQILQEMPAEQRQQQRELEYIHGSQIHQRQEIEELRKRIQRIEERQKARAKQS